MEDYDEEFGPNRVLRCDECSVKLMAQEVCWCLTNDEGGMNDEN